VNSLIFKDLPADATLPLRFPFDAFSRIRSSNHPGFFICNHLCAKMAREAESLPGSPYFGFIHVPKTGSGGMFTPDVCAAVIVNGMKKIPA
jgi:pyrrolidone-carboxylate peptidase